MEPGHSSILLLIDLQSYFTSGSWACHFGLEEVGPISDCFDTFRSIASKVDLHAKFDEVAITKCGWNTYDLPLDERVRPFLEQATCFHKPDTNIVDNPTFVEWMDSRIQGRDVSTLVIGGCTVTSCVRVSSIAIKRYWQDRLNVIVDMSICGARSSNYIRGIGLDDPMLVRKYGHELATKCSPVELSVHQMRQNGIVVVDAWDGWEKPSAAP
eukprot:jgi/Mesvir1/4936/Mv15926-RA.1